MSKKKTRASQSGPVWHRSAEEATLDKMPKYNAHICKTGPHGSAKYDRAKAKRDWQREMSQGIARTRGRFPFLGGARPSRCTKRDSPFWYNFLPHGVAMANFSPHGVRRRPRAVRALE